MNKESRYKRGWAKYKQQYKDYYNRDFVTDMRQVRDYGVIILIIVLLFKMCTA